MKKKLFILLLLVGLVGITGCTKTEEEEKKTAAIQFKEDYEAINGTENKNGKIHRTITIPEDNPYEEITPAELVKKIDNDETFYVYFGSRLCPWCRSVIEKATEVAKANDISKIYYIDIWDDEGAEILRSKYELKNSKATKIIDGTEEYYRFLEVFDSVLSEYTLTNDKGKTISTGEKRIYAPSFFYVKDGSVVKFTEGISEAQTGARYELTEEILNDEEAQFKEFFQN